MTIGKIDFTRTGHFMVYGNPDAGKTTAIEEMLSRIDNQRIAVVDYHDEYTRISHKPNVDRFIPSGKVRANREKRIDFLEKSLRKIKDIGYEIIIIDEANQYVRHKGETPDVLQDLKNNVAHEGWNNASAVFIMRRPSQFDRDFIETAKYVLLWRVPGRNTVNNLNDLQEGLGDMVKNLDRYEFIVMSPFGYFWKHDPIDL